MPVGISYDGINYYWPWNLMSCRYVDGKYRVRLTIGYANTIGPYRERTDV